MTLDSGTRIGPYEILAPLGKGGMGEVYRALDTKLERQVAIKILPAAVARDPERLARFDREAKVLASLNHPHIAQIYGIEESEYGRALILELVPGETLAQILKKGPLGLPETVRLATQIADAFEAAHDKGVTHRDLKPGNVMITPPSATARSSVKVLDFGLAAVTQPMSSGDPENSPTLTMARRNRALFWAPQATCLRNRRAACTWIGARISGPSAWCCGRCSRVSACSAARPFPTRWPTCCGRQSISKSCLRKHPPRCERCYGAAWTAMCGAACGYWRGAGDIGRAIDGATTAATSRSCTPPREAHSAVDSRGGYAWSVRPRSELSPFP